MRIESAQSGTDIQVPRCPTASRNSDGDKWCESRDLIRWYQCRRHNGRSSPPRPRRHSDCRNSCWDHRASDPRSNAPTSWLHHALPGIHRLIAEFGSSTRGEDGRWRHTAHKAVWPHVGLVKGAFDFLKDFCVLLLVRILA